VLTSTVRQIALLSFALGAYPALSQEAPTLPNLDIGDKVPPDATRMEIHSWTAPNVSHRLWLWEYQSVQYKLGVDDSGFVQFISTSFSSVATPEGVRAGQLWADLQNIPGARPAEYVGWGKVIGLPSGWKAYSHIYWQTTGDAVEKIIKGGGYGVRKPVPEPRQAPQ
jgi:hypothetical protein